MTLVLVIALVAALGTIAYLGVLLRQTTADLDESRAETVSWFNKAIHEAVLSTRRKFALDDLASIIIVDEDGNTIPRGPDEWSRAWERAVELIDLRDLDPSSPPVYVVGKASVEIRT